MQHQVANLAGSLNGVQRRAGRAVVEGPNVVTSSGKVDGMRDCPVHNVNPFKKFNNAAKFKDNGDDGRRCSGLLPDHQRGVRAGRCWARVNRGGVSRVRSRDGRFPATVGPPS